MNRRVKVIMTGAVDVRKNVTNPRPSLQVYGRTDPEPRRRNDGTFFRAIRDSRIARQLAVRRTEMVLVRATRCLFVMDKPGV